MIFIARCLHVDNIASDSQSDAWRDFSIYIQLQLGESKLRVFKRALFESF